jgi:N-acylneuraminate cytidylyltransferase
VTRTLVSTDDQEIAEVAQKAGANVPFLRPPEFATDTATDLDVFRHALEWLSTHENYRPELVVHLRPTGPVRDPKRIEEAVKLMLAHPGADALRSVGLAEQTPYKMWRVEGAFLQPVVRLPEYPEAHSMPRQSLPLAYWQNGYVDVIRPRTVLEHNSMCGSNVLAYVVTEPIYDLDYPDQIPALERAVRDWLSGNRAEASSECRYPV